MVPLLPSRAKGAEGWEAHARAARSSCRACCCPIVAAGGASEAAASCAAGTVLGKEALDGKAGHGALAKAAAKERQAGRGKQLWSQVVGGKRWSQGCSVGFGRGTRSAEQHPQVAVRGLLTWETPAR